MKLNIKSICMILALPLMSRASTPDYSLFSPTTDGKPDVQDVLQYVKVENQNYFDRAFSLVIFALAHNPARVQSLFKPLEGQDGDEGKYEFTFYEPVNHGFKSVPVSFDQVTDFQGGHNFDNITDRWWVAAAHGALKTEWESYYTPIQEDGSQSLPTQKAAEYEAFMSERYGWNITPVHLGDVDLKAVHWLMTVLLRRNIIASFSARDVPAQAGAAAKHSPAIWVGHGEENDIEGYLLPHVDTYTGTLVLLRPDGESTKTAPIDKIVVKDSWLLTSSDLEEAWYEGWYEKEGIPTIWDMPYTLAPAVTASASQLSASASASSSA